MEESCGKDYCGGIFCEGLLKMRSMWQWQLPQLLTSHFGELQKEKTSTTPEHIRFLSEMIHHTYIIKIQHSTYSYAMYVCGRVKIQRMPFPYIFSESLIDKYDVF